MFRFTLTLTAVLLGFAAYPQQEKPAKITAAPLQEGFGPLQLRDDSITIIGQYLHHKPQKGGIFSVSVYDFLSSDQIEFSTPIDSGGRFSLTVPAQAPCDIYIDWGVTWQRTIGIPGETIYFTADPAEYKDHKWMDSSFFNRKFSTRFEGSNARMHMEIMAFNNAYDGWFDNSYHSWPDELLPDLAFRDKVVHKKLQPEWTFLQNWIKKHQLEKKTIQYLEARILCQANFMLMQYLFKLLSLNQSQFSSGYMVTVDSIKNILPLQGYLSRDYLTVTRDLGNYASLATGRNNKISADSMYNTFNPLGIEKDLHLIWEVTTRFSRTVSPLPEADLKGYLSQVKDPYLRETINKRQQYFRVLDAHVDAEMQYTSYFSDTTGLGLLTSAEAIYRHITAPYRGKVVYLDIWGTGVGRAATK